jgi:hypothetical protein
MVVLLPLAIMFTLDNDKRDGTPNHVPISLKYF